MTRFIRDPKPDVPFAHILCSCLKPLDVADVMPGSKVQCSCGQSWVVDDGWLESLVKLVVPIGETGNTMSKVESDMNFLCPECGSTAKCTVVTKEISKSGTSIETMAICGCGKIMTAKMSGEPKISEIK